MLDKTDELLDIKQAAQLLRVSETSLRRWTNSGQLPCLRIGRRRERRFRRADLLAFLEVHPGEHSGGAPEPLFGGVPAPHGTHLCGLFTTDSARIQQAVQFLATGLRGRGTCFLVAGPTARDGILAELAHVDPGLKQEVDSGRLVLSEYASTYKAQLEYWNRELGKALRTGARRLWVIGDLLHGGAGDWNSFGDILDYEDDYDRLIARRYPVVTLCQYDARLTSGTELLATLQRHRDNFRYPLSTFME